MKREFNTDRIALEIELVTHFCRSTVQDSSHKLVKTPYNSFTQDAYVQLEPRVKNEDKKFMKI